MRRPHGLHDAPLLARIDDLKPTLPRACEVEALAWSTTTGWPGAPPADLPGLLRRIARAVLRRGDPKPAVLRAVIIES